MPGLTGIETALALLEQNPDLPIVLYSAHLDDDGLSAGAAVRDSALSARTLGLVTETPERGVRMCRGRVRR